MLDRRGAEFVGQLLVDGFALFAVVAVHAHLDQAVGIERGVGFLQHGGRQAVLADHDHRVEVVGFGAVGLAFGDGQFEGGHGSYYPAHPEGARVKVKTKSKKVNKAWLNDHVNDPYVKLAQKEGYRARAAYKLKEIDETLGLIRPGQLVVDLGSAPGAWSQYVRRRLVARRAPPPGSWMAPSSPWTSCPWSRSRAWPSCRAISARPTVLARLEQVLAGRKADVVVSDMAPNLSGIESVDAARISDLVELAVDFARSHLKPEGALVVKVFHGSGYSQLVRLFKETFRVVKPVKPKASRDRSSETFLVGIGLKNPAGEP